MRIKKLEISNILSIEKVELSFDDSGLILVEGWNYDANRGNGSGKSAIFNALSFGLYDKFPRDITKKDILRRGVKKGHVTVEVDVNDVTFSVTRTRPSGVFFKKDGDAWVGTQQEFESKLGLSYEQFLTTMYTNQDSDKRFISLNDRGKKDFILEVLKLKNFDKYDKEAKAQIKEAETNIKLKQVELSGLKSNKKTYEEMVVDDAYLQRLIDDNNDIIKAAQEQIEKYKKVQRPDLSKYEDLESKALDKILELKGIHNDIVSLQNGLRNLVSSVVPFNPRSPDASCPHCEGDLNISGHTLIKATDQDEMRRLHDKKIDGIRDEIRNVESQIKAMTLKLADEKKINLLRVSIKKQKHKDEYQYTEAIKSISECESSIKSKTLENNDYRNRITISKAKQAKLDKTISDICDAEAEIEALNAEIDMLKLTSSIFSPIGAPAYIMDAIVDSFNEAAEKYLTMVWPNATYKLQTHKVNSDKKVTAKFSESLIMNSKEVSIGSLSGGELKSLSLVMDFAIIDVLSKQYGTTINPIVLDEPFNGLDAVGKEIVIDLLDKMSRDKQIWVIDHASEAKTKFSDIVRIEKRNGVSSIV